MSTKRRLDETTSRRKARLKGFSPDGAEVFVSNDGEVSISGGNRKDYNTLVRVAKTYLAIIKENGFDISNLTQHEFSEINTILKELKAKSKS